MNNILSHSLTFKTDSLTSQTGKLENILYLSDENSSKHFVQYIQYHENNDDSIDVRHISIKVDRSYFLEIANICISNKERRRHFFSTLGKRRFGASNKHLDCYFAHLDFNEKSLHQKYLSHYEYIEFEPCHSITTKYSTNKYRIYIQEEENLHIVFLDQLNISSRKKIHKIFCTDLSDDDLALYNGITTSSQKINYIFNKIGKHYFKNLTATHLQRTKQYKTNEDLALSMLIKDSQAMERSSRIQDNTTFRKLQEKQNDMKPILDALYKEANKFILNPCAQTAELFTRELQMFQVCIKGINGLKDISDYLQEVYELSTKNTISYLLSKDDEDLQDIFLYVLEVFHTWNKHLFDENEDIKSFNSVSIDLADAFRYFVDVCYKFKHDYKCTDAEEEIQKEVSTALELETQQEPENELTIKTPVYTSAQSYFAEIDLDSEVYDELLELEREVDVLSYASSYNEDINATLINFFEGYTRVLNPLFEFKDLSYSLMLLTQKLTDYEIDENSEMLLILMRGLISDLLEWKRSVLIEQTAEDIHFMDKSFYSNIAQIEMSLDSNDLAEDDGEMEFF
ncbi:hypothetical protein JHD46_03990 [Sulfurimonas sp. SAG-AH-194-C20]|nr:hypothetical protein [Sulfurimonas sp. SAG-AH-194-C20]MDF1878797.1 hypothetical protein [Sulfurimonas sp. SAG-AH-194-C20]